MVSSIGGINTVNMFSALNAFKTSNIQQTEQVMPEVSEGLNINDSNDVLKNQDLSEIKNIAKCVGEDNISDEDIQYGLTYGRSVIADFSA